MAKKIAFCIFLLLLVAVHSCTAEEVADAEQIAKGDVARYNSYAFKDEVVAWLEYGTDEDGLLESSIRRYNLSTGVQELVIADPSGKSSLDFSGDRYVWSDQRGIYLYDESEGKVNFLYSKNPQHNPVIDGDTMVWSEETADGSSILRVYDISTGECTEISHGYLNSIYYPAISGEWIAFVEEDLYSGEKMIYLTNINRLNQFSGLGSMPADVDQPPSISGNTVVWTGETEGNFTTYYYDINTRKSGPVDPSGSAQLCPYVSGTHIVWLDFGPYPQNLPWGGDLILHDTESGKTEEIVTGRKEDYPKVSGDYIVWLNSWGDEHEIYLYSFLDDGRVFSSDEEDGTGEATPTPLPTPGTKIRYYSKIKECGIDWYSLTPSENTQLSFEVRWKDPSAELALSVVSPSGEIWNFIDSDDDKDDEAIRMTIRQVDRSIREAGRWTVAVSGDKVNGEIEYDICWY